jgi:hypothetical protein
MVAYFKFFDVALEWMSSKTTTNFKPPYKVLILVTALMKKDDGVTSSETIPAHQHINNGACAATSCYACARRTRYYDLEFPLPLPRVRTMSDIEHPSRTDTSLEIIAGTTSDFDSKHPIECKLL